MEAEQIRKQAEDCLNRAIELRLDLSADEVMYQYDYITDKLAKVASMQETLSDMSLGLTNLSLMVTQKASNLRGLNQLKEAQFKASEEYQALARDKRKGWIDVQLEVLRDEERDWTLTRVFLTEIRKAVDDRIQTMRRLDSDLRLQEKVLEAKIRSGAGSPLPAGTGVGGSEAGHKAQLATIPTIGELQLD